MDENDPNQRKQLDPRAVPIAVGSFVLIAVGVVLTYSSTSLGAFVVLAGLAGIVWLAVIAAKQPPPDS